jgi:hypothetical protein
VPVLLSIGINRMLGTLTVFDLDAGAIYVSRTLERMTLFRRKFRIGSVVQVFNDRRPYVRPTIQNPKLQLSSGRQINLPQWCPSEFDFEAETYAATGCYALETSTSSGCWTDGEIVFRAVWGCRSPNVVD